MTHAISIAVPSARRLAAAVCAYTAAKQARVPAPAALDIRDGWSTSRFADEEMVTEAAAHPVHPGRPTLPRRQWHLVQMSSPWAAL